MASEFQLALFKLPILAINAVLLNVDLGDLIHFSFASKRVYRIIKSLRIKLTFFIIYISKQETSVELKCAGRNQNGHWIFNHVEFVKQGIYLPKSSSIGSGVTSFVSRGWLFSYSKRNAQKVVKSGIERITELFCCPLPEVYIFPDGLTRWKRSLIVGFDRCKSLNVHGDQPLRVGDWKLIISSLTVTKKIVVRIPIRDTFKQDIGLWNHLETIHIARDAHWITSEMFLNSTCVQMAFRDCKLTANDVRSFVKRWFDSDDRHFKFLQLAWAERLPEGLNFNGLGFELREFDRESRSSTYRYSSVCSVDFSSARDFIRKDGILASIIVTQISIRFCVWLERFPNSDGGNVLEM